MSKRITFWPHPRSLSMMSTAIPVGRWTGRVLRVVFIDELLRFFHRVEVARLVYMQAEGPYIREGPMSDKEKGAGEVRRHGIVNCYDGCSCNAPPDGWSEPPPTPGERKLLAAIFGSEPPAEPITREESERIMRAEIEAATTMAQTRHANRMYTVEQMYADLKMEPPAELARAEELERRVRKVLPLISDGEVAAVMLLLSAAEERARLAEEKAYELEGIERSAEMHADLNRRTAKALGKPFEGKGSSWHDIPKQVAALREKIRDCEAEHPPEPWAAELEARCRAAEERAEGLQGLLTTEAELTTTLTREIAALRERVEKLEKAARRHLDYSGCACFDVSTKGHRPHCERQELLAALAPAEDAG